MVVGIVALIVIGPKRLPAVARTVGYFVGRARRYVENVKQDLRNEMELDELRKIRDSMQEATRSFEGTIRQEMREIQETVKPGMKQKSATQSAPPSLESIGDSAASSGSGAVDSATTSSPSVGNESSDNHAR